MLSKKIELLCITYPRKDMSYYEQVELACQGGADMIQFRDKELSDKDILETAVRLGETIKWIP